MSSFDCKLLQFYKLTLAGKNDKIGFNDSYFHTSLIGFVPNGFLFLLNPIKKYALAHPRGAFFDWKMMEFSYFCLLLAYHLLHNFKQSVFSWDALSMKKGFNQFTYLP